MFYGSLVKSTNKSLATDVGETLMLHELDLEALYVCHGLSENSKNFDYYTILYYTILTYKE